MGAFLVFHIFNFHNRYHWVLKASNGCVLARSNRSYSNKINCVRAINKIRYALWQNYGVIKKGNKYERFRVP